MTGNLLERLRSEAVNWSATCGDLFGEAADEIERLRAALKPFADAGIDAEGYPADHPVGCDPQAELAIEIGDGAYGPLKVRHLRAATAALVKLATSR